MKREFVETYREFQVEAFELNTPEERAASDGYETGYHARRGRLHVVSPQTTEDSLEAVHETIDVLLSPRRIRDVDALN